MYVIAHRWPNQFMADRLSEVANCSLPISALTIYSICKQLTICQCGHSPINWSVVWPLHFSRPYWRLAPLKGKTSYCTFWVISRVTVTSRGSVARENLGKIYSFSWTGSIFTYALSLSQRLFFSTLPPHPIATTFQRMTASVNAYSRWCLFCS